MSDPFFLRMILVFLLVSNDEKGKKCKNLHLIEARLELNQKKKKHSFKEINVKISIFRRP